MQARWLTPKLLVCISEFQRAATTTTTALFTSKDEGKQLFQKLGIQQKFWQSQFTAFMLDEKIPLDSAGRFCIKEGYPMYVLQKEIAEVFPTLPNIFSFTRGPLVKDVSVIVLDEVPSSSTAKDEKAALNSLNKYGHSLVNRQDWVSQGVLRLPICLTARDSSHLNSHCMDNPAAVAVPLWEVGVAQALKKLLNEVLHHPVPILAVGTKKFVDLHLRPIRKDHKVVYTTDRNFLNKDYFGELNKFLMEVGRPQIRW